MALPSLCYPKLLRALEILEAPHFSTKWSGVPEPDLPCSSQLAYT